MKEPAVEYSRLLSQYQLQHNVSTEPQAFLSLTDSWTNITVRYLVAVRERRKWSTTLIRDISRDLASPKHAGRIAGSYPRSRIELIDKRFDDEIESSQSAKS